MSYIEITNLNKTYSADEGSSIKVLKNINLDIQKGEFVTFFGPNGCGKSTLLNIVAGLIDYDSGTITINNKNPKDTKTGFVFQDYSESLFPWQRNIDNIAFSLDSSRGSKKKKHGYIKKYLKEIGLDELPINKYPYQSSAGQQQLVALVRELIYNPDVLLMDEPFVSLDYDRRISQQEFFLSSIQKTSTTILFVSHEIDEAIFLSDRLVLLSQRPASIINIFDITLPRPRKIELLGTEEFFKLKAPILKKFMEIIGK
jgi:NitT/TauT family transport system ATP-binding protein